MKTSCFVHLKTIGHLNYYSQKIYMFFCMDTMNKHISPV